MLAENTNRRFLMTTINKLLTLSGASLVGAAVHAVITKDDNQNDLKNKIIQNALVAFSAMTAWLNAAAPSNLGRLPKIAGAVCVATTAMLPVAHHAVAIAIRELKAEVKAKNEHCEGCTFTAGKV